MERIIAALPRRDACFYRASARSEIDLLQTKSSRTVAVEFKASSAPTPERGSLQALEQPGVQQRWIAAPVDEPYPYKKKTTLASPEQVPEPILRGP